MDVTNFYTRDNGQSKRSEKRGLETMATITWTCIECGRESQKSINAEDDIAAKVLIRQLREDFEQGQTLFLCAVEPCDGRMYPLRIEGTR